MKIFCCVMFVRWPSGDDGVWKATRLKVRSSPSHRERSDAGVEAGRAGREIYLGCCAHISHLKLVSCEVS